MSVKYLISSQKKQYKANLHCHSTLSDGRLTPTELKNAYRKNGYSVLAITDHCVPHDHSALTEKDFLMFTGYEAHIRADEKFNAYASEIHMNLLAKESGNTTIIGYDPRFSKFMPVEEYERLRHAGPTRPREYTVEYINEFMAAARESGYIVSYNHPWWSLEDEERIMSYTGIDSLEIDNSGSELSSGLEHAELLYDRMLRRGMRIGCHSADDNHNVLPFGDPKCDSFHSYTMILADRLDYKSVADALENKEYYASAGPRIYELCVTDGERVSVRCSPASKIILNVGSKAPKSIICPDGETVCEAEFPLDAFARYVRITVQDEKGKKAVSRGFFPDKFK